MLINCSLTRSAHSFFLALLGALALTALAAGSAGAAVTPDQAFGKAGVVSLELDAPLDDYDWDYGTALQDGSVAFLAARGTPRPTHRPPVIRVIRADGSIDRNLGPKYRIPFPGSARKYFIDRNIPSAVERQADGKLLIAGGALIPTSGKRYRGAWYVIRLLKSGKRDRSFGSDGLTLISDRGTSYDRSLLVATGPKVISFDRLKGILLFGKAPDSDIGPVLARLRRDGVRDRSFRRNDEDPGIDARSKLYMRATDSGEIVTARTVYREYGTRVDAVIHRYSSSGKDLGEKRIELPGIGSRGSCNGKCGDGPPSILAKILPTGAILLVGGENYVDSSPLGTISKIDPTGKLDSSFGTGGRAELTKPYEYGTIIQAIDGRPNGEVWAVVAVYRESNTELRLVRLAASGALVRPADGSIGTPFTGTPPPYGVGIFDFVGLSLIEHGLDGQYDSAIRPLVVGRWNLTF